MRLRRNRPVGLNGPSFLEIIQGQSNCFRVTGQQEGTDYFLFADNTPGIAGGEGHMLAGRRLQLLS